VAGELLFLPKFLRISRSCYPALVRNLAVLFVHFIAVLARLLGPGGVRSLGRGVASPQTPTPDRESLPATIAESVGMGPHPGRPAGAFDASNSSAPFRNCAEAFDTARSSQSLERA
jgi:hypothetical protein